MLSGRFLLSISGIIGLTAIFTCRLLEYIDPTKSSSHKDLIVMFALVVGISWISINTALTPNLVKSKNYHNCKSTQYKALRRKYFFPGFANGWHVVCSAEDVKHGNVKSISALGTHMVAFRGQDGKAGVLHAFCPHLGAHLGEGGTIEGNLLVCPFHRWSFDVTGKCQRIPYMKPTPSDCDEPKVPDRARTKAYPVREILGMILVWFHAEEEHADIPLYEPEVFDDLARGVSEGKYYYSLMRSMEFEQHSCEMAMNSADQHHFDSLHAPFPIPFIEKFVTGVHKTSVMYGKGVVDGEEVDREHLTLFREKTQGLYFFGNQKYPVFLSEAASALVDTTVVFEGPTIVHFLIDTPFGRLRQVMTLLSVEPFKQYVESRWYAESTVPAVVVHFIAYIGANALEQDRQVWESKMFHMKPMLVNGDGPFPAFIRWYGQFYSKSSKDLETSLDW